MSKRTRRRSGTRLLVGFLCTILLATTGCRSGAGSRVVVLGLDGMDPDIVDLLVSEGQLPNFARLRRGGATGRLISERPMLSPILWTTVATGKPLADHRIGHFVARNEKTGEELPVTSRMRGVKALWNIFSDARLRVGVVGWWATWPAEPVNGAIVSDHTCYHFLFEDGATGSADETGVTYPAGLYAEIASMVRRPGDVEHCEVERFVKVSAEDFARPFSFDDELSHFKWAYAAAESHRAIGKYLWRTQDPDLLLVYIEGTDSVSHLFGHLFLAERLAGNLLAQFRRFGDAVEEFYRHADRVVGDYLDMVDGDTTLIVLSDHGFELGALPDDPTVAQDLRRVSEKFHRPEGILYAFGKNVRGGARFERPTLIDIAPTVLALGGLSPASDMPGRVLLEGLSLPAVSRSVRSYETPGAADDPGGRGSAVDPAIVERLRALGYLDTESPKSARNLAADLFRAGKHAEAAQAYRELVAKSPRDGGLRASHAGALGALGRFEEAQAEIAEAIRLRPIDPEAYHNRGVLYERMGRSGDAVASYREALRYQPAYRPSREALQRLTAQEDPSPTLPVAQQRAVSLAGQAAERARRGDYSGAISLLDRAAILAPELAMVWHHHANVAFLMGDRDRARQALERALAIEPDNELFRSNLEKLGP